MIGRGGVMPWHIPSDLKTFRRLTMGKPVIMGRKTFQSIGKPLPGRDNIVVTRDPSFSPGGVLVARSLDEAIAKARSLASERGGTEIMVIGGGEIYAQALPLADRVYLTRVHAHPEGDATFPPLPPSEWQLERSEPIMPADADEHRCTLMVYARIHGSP